MSHHSDSAPFDVAYDDVAHSDVEVPGWFTTALADRPTHHTAELAGTQIHYRGWGGRGQPVVVLVHGGSAHGGWWDHVGPLLAARHRVIAPDLSGHGDSGRRDAYGLPVWVPELAALVREVTAESGESPVVVGHSMGGWVALALAAAHPELPGEVVVVDSPFRRQPPEQSRPAPKPARVYLDRADALAHFRLTPAQDRVALPYVLAHVAGTSLRAVEGGWSWKFDPRILGRRGEPRPDLGAVSCPVTLLCAERGMLPLEDAGRAAAAIGGPVTVAQIPDAGHHVMMDSPLALVTALRVVLAERV